MKRLFSIILLLGMAELPGLVLAESVEVEADSGWYVGTSGGMLLPGNGNSLRP